MAKTRSTIISHHDPNPVYFTLTQSEVDMLKERSRLPEKENTYFLVGLFVPATLNAIARCRATPFQIDPLLIINLLVSVVTLILGILQGKEWFVKRNNYDHFIAELKSKPQVKMQISDDLGRFTIQTENPPP
jgi:hypothetical protein